MGASDDFVDRMIGGPSFNRDEQRQRRFREAAKAAQKAAKASVVAPRPYDLSDPADGRRLLLEIRGYLHTSRNHGTDQEGRRLALEALSEAIVAGWTLTPP